MDEVHRSEERASLFDVPGVWGVGVTKVDGVMCLKVFISDGTPDLRAHIPPVVDGLPTVIEVADRPVAL